jgi:beta-glucosidase-like glycosyl hydrolase
MGAALAQGIQTHNFVATVKHFAVDSMETARFKVDVIADERTLHEVYLPHLRRAIEAGCASVMSADNKVNGEYCGENRALELEAAEKSAVLLVNDGALPLSRDKVSKLAVLGRLAALENTGEFGSSRVRPPYVVTPLEGLGRYVGDAAIVTADESDPTTHTWKLETGPHHSMRPR